jgi:hypothetical protein
METTSETGEFTDSDILRCFPPPHPEHILRAAGLGPLIENYGLEAARRFAEAEVSIAIREERREIMRAIGASGDLDITEALFASQAWLQKKLGLSAGAEANEIARAFYGLADGDLRSEVDPVYAWYALNAYQFHRRPSQPWDSGPGPEPATSSGEGAEANPLGTEASAAPVVPSSAARRAPEPVEDWCWQDRYMKDPRTRLPSENWKRNGGWEEKF